MGSTTPTTTNNATMSVNDVSTLIIQQVQQQTATLMSRISELERVVNERQEGQHVGRANGNGLGGTMKAAKPSMYGGDMGSDVEAWLFQVLQFAYITGIAEDDRAKWAATYLPEKP